MLIAILVVVNILLFYKITNFDVKFQTLKEALIKIEKNKQPLDKDILISQFKEESYIRQQERDTTLILLVFTLFASAVAFITYRGFVNKIVDYTASTEQKYTDHKTEYDKQHNIILELKSRIDHEMAFKYYTYASDSYREKFYDDYLDSTLTSISYYVEYYFYLTNEDATLSAILISDLETRLKKAYERVKGKSVKDISKHSTGMSIDNIRKLNNTEINKYLDLISAKIIKDIKKKKPLKTEAN